MGENAHEQSMTSRIVESMIAGAVGGVLGVVIQRLVFGTTKNLMIGVVVAVFLDVTWQLARNKARRKSTPSDIAD